MSGGIRVEPITREWADALADGDAEFAARFDVAVEAGWEGFPEAVALLVAAGRSHRPVAWRPCLFFDTDGALVGNGGWKGPPVDGAVELGYAVAPSRQRRGIATAAVRELIDRARAADVETVLAHTLPHPSPSTTVLERCGFELAGETVDPDEGPVWRWELSLRG